ncbi:MAG: NTP transferase domain-containing protein [Deltaproteobacteria bacterium]|nr:NTP transferase domain-containing protein [Deltaproteobacteria bacterium]
MQVVLLAAGMGLRLGPLTRTAPKALVSLRSKALIDYAIESFLVRPQVEEILVVGGSAYDLLEEHLQKRFAAHWGRIKLVQNSNFEWGNFYSLKSALPYLKKDFLLSNVDHVFEEKAWNFLLTKQREPCVFCDFDRDFLEDEMKVRLDQDHYLKGLSKTYETYEGAYVGVTYVPLSYLEVYKKASQSVEEKYGEKAVVEQVISQLALEHTSVKVKAFDEYRWFEVDTQEDLKKAELGLSDFTPIRAELKEAFGF